MAFRTTRPTAASTAAKAGHRPVSLATNQHCVGTGVHHSASNSQRRAPWGFLGVKRAQEGMAAQAPAPGPAKVVVSCNATAQAAGYALGDEGLPGRSVLEVLGGHLRWLKYMLMAIPIWAYQGTMYLVGAVLAGRKIAYAKNRNNITYPDPFEGLQHEMVEANGLQFNTVTAGKDPKKPLMLLLHGFPELWYSWRNQLEEFRDTHEVVAVDMRGYNLSEKPKGRASYSLEFLADDVAALIGALGRKRCTLVAHDWGGLVAWHAAAGFPHMVEKLVILGLPHPCCFFENMDRDQMRRSWYMLLFYCPGLPERMLLAADCASMDGWLTGKAPIAPRRRGAITPEDLEWYKQAIQRPGALTAALNYYRAWLNSSTRSPSRRFHALQRRLQAGLDMPVLMVYGANDSALGPQLLKGTERYVRELELHVLDDCSHWVQQDAPDRLHPLMRKFLGMPAAAAPVPTPTAVPAAT